MDPNANLREQESLQAISSADDIQRRAELRRALTEWLERGGFKPNWRECPEATRTFRAWMKRREYLASREDDHATR